MFQIIFDSVLVVDVQETSLWSSEDSGVVLDCVAFRRSVDDAEHFFDVVLDELGLLGKSVYPRIYGAGDMYSIIQNLILRLHARHKRILPQVIALAGVLLISAPDLLLQRLHVRRQQAVQAELIALLLRESRSFVEVGVVEEGVALDCQTR